MKNSTSTIRFRDLRITDKNLKKKLLRAVSHVFDSGQLLMGPQVTLLEEHIAAYCGRKYCVGVSSGTDALYLALRGLGIGPDDEVICPAISWIATANAISMTGATPVFVDTCIDQNIDSEKIESAITSKTKAILPVHFTGQLADMTSIIRIARKHHLVVIEDAAQAFGAEHLGIRAGGFGDAAAFSLNPMKVLPGYGENGAIVTDSIEVYEKIHSLRYLGTIDKERCEYISLNFKMDEIQAAMLLVSLENLPNLLSLRRTFASYYNSKLQNLVMCPTNPDESTVVFDYQIQVQERDKLMAFLADHGIETRIKHPIIMADQPVYTHLPYRDLPVARQIVQRILSLPLHENLSYKDLDKVVFAIQKFYSLQ